MLYWKLLHEHFNPQQWPLIPWYPNQTPWHLIVASLCRQRGGSSCAPPDADGGPETGGWDAHGSVQKGTGAASDVHKDEGKKSSNLIRKII